MVTGIRKNCRRGHKLTPDNSYWFPNGTRWCLTCKNNYYANRNRDDYKWYYLTPVAKLKRKSRSKARQIIIKYLIQNNIVPKCLDCGKEGLIKKSGHEKTIDGLQVCHEDQNCLNNEFGNLKIRCAPCHKKFDSGKPKVKIVIPANP